MSPKRRLKKKRWIGEAWGVVKQRQLTAVRIAEMPPIPPVASLPNGPFPFIRPKEGTGVATTEIDFESFSSISGILGIPPPPPPPPGRIFGGKNEPPLPQLPSYDARVVYPNIITL